MNNLITAVLLTAIIFAASGIATPYTLIAPHAALLLGETPESPPSPLETPAEPTRTKNPNAATPMKPTKKPTGTSVATSTLQPTPTLLPTRQQTVEPTAAPLQTEVQPAPVLVPTSTPRPTNTKKPRPTRAPTWTPTSTPLPPELQMIVNDWLKENGCTCQK